MSMPAPNVTENPRVLSRIRKAAKDLRTHLVQRLSPLTGTEEEMLEDLIDDWTSNVRAACLKKLILRTYPCPENTLKLNTLENVTAEAQRGIASSLKALIEHRDQMTKWMIAGAVKNRGEELIAEVVR
jgi:hypothetical protein